MNIINVKVNFTRGTCEVSGINLITGDYNSTKMVFTFDRDDGTKIFEMKSPSEELVMVQEIQNNEIVLYGLDDNKQVASLFKEDGSYIFEISLYENGSKLTSASGKIKVKPEQVVIDDEVVEAYIPVFDQLLNDITTTVQGLEDDVDDKLDGVDAKLGDVDTKLLEVDNKLDDVDGKIDTIEGQIKTAEEIVDQANNLDLDISKSGKTTTVTITKKDETTESENILDGKNLEFVWSGTSLGVRVEGDSEYTYVNLQGVQGPVGPQGEPFKIKKTYSSISEMNADFNNMNIGDYVMIANSVETEDNAKLYTKTITQWVFITDFSGATGIQGPTGPAPSISIGTVTSGSTSSVTRTGTDENPVFNFVLEKGDKGDTGATGATGNGIASITKISSVDTTDTYRITYTDGTTYDYEITNGEVSQKQLDEVKAELERYKLIENALPKVSGTGTSITLDNTANAGMTLELNPSELEQETTTGKNLVNASLLPITSHGITISKDANGNIVLNGTPDYNSGYEQFIIGTSTTLEAGTYTISVADKKDGLGITVGGFNGELNLTMSDTMTHKTSTSASSNTVYLNLNIRYDVGTFNNYILNPMIETGSSATTYEPYTNGASPNPQYPQQVHTISGSNEIIITGSNIIGNVAKKQYKVNLKTGDKITIHTNEPNTIYLYTNYGDETRNDYWTFTAGQTRTITISQDSQAIAWMFDTAGNSWINYGDTLLPYEPYQEQTATITLGDLEYSAIGKYKDQFYKPSGKNLFNLINNNLDASWDSGKPNAITIINNSTLSTTANFGDWRAKCIEIPNIKPNTKYTLSCKVVSSTGTNNTTNISIKNYNGATITTLNGTYGETANVGNFTTTFTTSNDVTHLGLSISCIGNGTSIISEIMINEGSTALPYEPYNNGKWYIKKNIGKVVLDGSENWSYNGTSSSPSDRSVIQVQNIIYPLNDNYLSNYFIKGSTTSNRIVLGTTIFMSIENTITGIVSDDTENQIVEKMKLWLSTHNTIVDYILNTPQYILLNDTLQEQLEYIYNQMLAYKGQTNISQINSDLPFDMMATALKDLSSL